MSASLDFFSLDWAGVASLWNLFWHAILIILAVLIIVMAIIFSVMASVLVGAQSSVRNEGYLGFDEPNSPPTPGDE